MGASNKKSFYFQEQRKNAYKGDLFSLTYSMCDAMCTWRGKNEQKRKRERKIIDEPPIIYISIYKIIVQFFSLHRRPSSNYNMNWDFEWKKEEKETITACTQNSCLLWNIPLSFPFPKHDHRSAWDKFIYTHSDVLEAIVELKLLREFFFRFFFLS